MPLTQDPVQSATATPATVGAPGFTVQMSPNALRAARPGEIYNHYAQHLDWLQPNLDGTGCLGNWTPITEQWKAADTEALWKCWEKLLPLFLDPTVEEIWIQSVQNHPTDPTPVGLLDIITDGFLGKRQHPHLRMRVGEYIAGLEVILGNKNESLYSLFKPSGRKTVPSALELQGVRLTAGVPPVSTAPFGAIRIPARQRPTLEHIAGVKRFGSDIDLSLKADGSPLPFLTHDPLTAARAAIAAGVAEGKVMIPLEALEYLQATKTVGWNCIYSGATSSAKTTTLNAAIALCPSHWRIVTVETGVAELKLPHINWVPLFCDDDVEGMRQADILKLAMRMSPTAIPCGEIRGVEGALWAEIGVSGHVSNDTSLHAGSEDEAFMRGTRMVLSGSKGLLTEDTARVTTAMVANVIVQMAREDVVVDGAIVSARRCISISEVILTGSYTEGTQKVELRKVFQTDYTPRGPVLKFTGKTRLFEVMETSNMKALAFDWAKHRA